MKNQVTTIEQSRRLLELSVPAEKASMDWLQKGEWRTDICEWVITEGYALMPKDFRPDDNISSNFAAPAYTVADLLGMMPSRLMRYEVSYFMTITREHGRWSLHWHHSQFDCIGYIGKTSLIALLCDRIEWLVSNGYKLEV